MKKQLIKLVILQDIIKQFALEDLLLLKKKNVIFHNDNCFIEIVTVSKSISIKVSNQTATLLNHLLEDKSADDYLFIES